MQTTRARLPGIVIVAAISMCIAALAATQPIGSQWRTRDVRIDGNNDEWQDTVALDAISVGAINDDQFLYLSVMTSDQQRRRQLETSGLIVWLDASGGKKQTFGIKLPGSGIFAGAAGGRRGRFDGSSPDGQLSGTDAQVPALTYFEVLGPGKDDRRRVERAADSGIDVAENFREGTLVCELKVPLSKTAGHAYAIGTEPGRKIGFGLETSQTERPRASFGGGGGGGRGGGRGG